MRPLHFWMVVPLLGAACSTHRSTANPPPVRSPAPPPPAVVRDTALEHRAARLELRLLERDAQVEELQGRLDDARREVVRAMAKLQSLATRAEAASGMAEAEIALQAVRAAGGGGGGNVAPAPEAGQAAQLLQLATAEFNKQNYAGALYLATQAKNAAAAGQERVASGERGALRPGEVSFALPLRLQTTARANVRDGPGAGFAIAFTLEVGTPLTAYSYLEQWVRVTDENGRPGWIYQGLIERRR